MFAALSRFNNERSSSLATCTSCVVACAMLLLVTVVPALFLRPLDGLISSFSLLSTLLIVSAICAMFPVMLLVRLCTRPHFGALVSCLGFAVGEGLALSMRTGLPWPAPVLIGWLLGSLGLFLYGLIIGTLHQMRRQLERAYMTIQQQALTDTLTGQPNHRALMEQIEKEHERARRYGRPFALIFFDADRFKRINDTYGHAAGDMTLRQIGECAASLLRGGDTLGRYGGEEFVVLLPETDGVQASLVAERIRSAVACTPVPLPGEERIDVTVSLGVATYPIDGLTVQDVLSRADQAMYWAKKLGRNQVRTAHEAQLASRSFSLSVQQEAEGSRDGTSTAAGDPVTVHVSQVGLMYSLLRLVELRDPAMPAHAHEVSDLSAVIASALDLDQQAVLLIATSALLHDIGKIAIPDVILKKTGHLSAQEWAIIRQHPDLGAQILETSPVLRELASAVRHHHERWDGAGYPDGLSGQHIPLGARIIAIAEAYNAMLTACSYQAGRSPDAAVQELQRCAGSQFDPAIVAVAIPVLRDWQRDASPGQVAAAMA